MNDNTQAAPLVSIEELSAALNVSTRTLRRLVEAGEIEHYRVGPKLYRFDLERTLESFRRGAA